MKSRRLSFLALAGIVALALSACAPTAETGTPTDNTTPIAGGNLVVGSDAEPIGLDPTTIAAFSSYDFTAVLYNGLLRWNKDMEIEPDLAESYENPTPTQYVFHLREGVKFHNGQPLTAADVVYTFERIKNPETASPHIGKFATVDSITAVDDYTVQFDLNTPDAAFLSYIATNPDGAIIPEGVADLATNPVGTGPFKFDSYTTGQKLVVVKNPDYYEKGLPLLDSVTFTFLKDQSSIVSALRSDSVDMSWLKDPKVAASTVKSDPSINSVEGKASRTFPVWINSANGDLADVRVRQALSIATDRDAALQTVLGGSGEIAAVIPSTVFGGYKGDGSDMPNYESSADKAKKLLAEAGFPNGIDLGEYKIVAANDLDVQVAQVLEQQWKAAGITVTLVPMETAPLLADWTAGNYGLLSVALVWVPDPDAIANRFLSTTSIGQSMGMSDTELDKLIVGARAELDPEARAADYLKIQKHIADNAYVLNVYGYPLRWEVYQDYVQGYEVMGSNIRSYLRTTWLSK